MPLYLTEEDVASLVTIADAITTLLPLRRLTGLRHILPRYVGLVRRSTGHAHLSPFLFR